MNNCNTKQKYAEIVPGSKSEFTLVLSDQDGSPLNLSLYSAGKLRFKNLAGILTEVLLTVPGLNPGSGIVPVIITAVQTALADAGWVNCDLVLTETLTSQAIIKPFEDKFVIKLPHT